jgi:hypothetical protein
LKPTTHYKEDTIMSPHVRIADRLTTQSAEQLVATAATIITGLTQNPAFPSPPVDLKTVPLGFSKDLACGQSMRPGRPRSQEEAIGYLTVFPPPSLLHPGAGPG